MTAPAAPSAYVPQKIAPPANPTPAQFLAVVNELLGRNPPQGRMAMLAQHFRPIGIWPGQTEVWADLPEVVRSEWSGAWATLRAKLLLPATLQTRRVGGWEFPPAEVGNWGDNDLLRAAVALRGIAALDGQEALYLSTYVDIDGQVLEGSGTYRVRFPPGGLPARGFLSLTLYEALPDGRFFLVGSSIINRYSIGNRTVGLQKNSDGSIDILVQQRASGNH